MNIQIKINSAIHQYITVVYISDINAAYLGANFINCVIRKSLNLQF